MVAELADLEKETSHCSSHLQARHLTNPSMFRHAGRLNALSRYPDVGCLLFGNDVLSTSKMTRFLQPLSFVALAKGFTLFTVPSKKLSA